MVKRLAAEFKEFLRYLNEENVEYLVIGGYAVSFHGFSRFTAGIDVWIALDQSNVARVVKALERFGFVHGEASEGLFLKPGNIVRIGMPPMRIEIMNQIDGLNFESSYQAREMVRVDGVELPMISKDDLIINKRASNRQKDRADLEGLGEEI